MANDDVAGSSKIVAVYWVSKVQQNDRGFQVFNSGSIDFLMSVELAGTRHVLRSVARLYRKKLRNRRYCTMFTCEDARKPAHHQIDEASKTLRCIENDLGKNCVVSTGRCALQGGGRRWPVTEAEQPVQEGDQKGGHNNAAGKARHRKWPHKKYLRAELF